MMKGNGFVRFVSVRYLRELCSRANERFFTLTGKSLALEVDDSGEFLVRDYLNGGKTRSVKTLSGGQTFQASFSLAIALSESVRKERESFFFLDEGFGSLDRDSLSLVFETLKSLRAERSIVGVISHVEAMKEEIDTALLVKKDPARGSVISYGAER
jgi:exonuclease SbcC